MGRKEERAWWRGVAGGEEVGLEGIRLMVRTSCAPAPAFLQEVVVGVISSSLKDCCTVGG